MVAAQSGPPPFAAWAKDAVEVMLCGLEDGAVTACAAAADVLMDVFSSDDAPLHDLYRSTGAHARIAEGLAAMRAKIGSSAEKEAVGREAVAHVKEVVLNTVRFLKYKATNFRV